MGAFSVMPMTGIMVVSLTWITLAVAATPRRCDYPAIYNFGDSNSDTGGISAAFSARPPPNGETFFKHPAGRNSDGRLLIDFIAEELRLPYLSAYLDSLGTNFRHGANFATGGSTIRWQNDSLNRDGISPFSLPMQMLQFGQFKDRTGYLYNHAKSSEKKELPRQEEFAKALYTFDIGQNDLYFGFRNTTYDQLRATIPIMLNYLSSAIQGLYQNGARTFWIHNTGPLGCLPITIKFLQSPKPESLDKNGCIKTQNDMAVEFNKQLKIKVVQLRKLLPKAVLVYVDMYSAKYKLISDAQNQGFVNPLKICCGRQKGDIFAVCGHSLTVNNTEIFGGSCADPSKYISWDGTHFTEAANRWLANHVLSGALSDPPVSISRACFK